MSSASLVEKRTLRKSQSRTIGTSSTSITSAPPTTSESKKRGNSGSRPPKDTLMRSKQRDSLPDIGTRKGNRSVRASNFELSSSGNGFDSATNIDRQSVTKASGKTRNSGGCGGVATSAASRPTKSEAKPSDDKVMELLKMDSMAQENYKYISFFIHNK